MEKADLELERLKLQKAQIESQNQSTKLLQQALEKALPVVEKYFNAKLERVESPKVRWSIIGFIGILLMVLVMTSFLVYKGKLDSSNFTFLLGTLIGATISLLGDVILPKE